MLISTKNSVTGSEPLLKLRSLVGAQNLQVLQFVADCSELRPVSFLSGISMVVTWFNLHIKKHQKCFPKLVSYFRLNSF